MKIIVDGDSVQIGPWYMEVINGKLVITNTCKIYKTTLAEFPVEVYSRGEIIEMSARSIKLPL